MTLSTEPTFTEEAKKRHEAVQMDFALRNPVDWGADWKELKQEMECEKYSLAYQVLKSYGSRHSAEIQK